MLDTTNTQTYYNEPDWTRIQDELVYLANIELHGWWGEFGGASICQENVLRTFGCSASRLLYGLTKGEDYGCLEETLGDFSCWLQHTGDVCYADEPIGKLMREVEVDTDDVVRFLSERTATAATKLWLHDDERKEAGRAVDKRLMSHLGDDYPEPNWDLIAQLSWIEWDEMFGFDFGAGGFASAYTKAILPFIGEAARGIAMSDYDQCDDYWVAMKVRWMLELLGPAGDAVDNDFPLRRRLNSLRRGYEQIESCLKPKIN